MQFKDRMYELLAYGLRVPREMILVLELIAAINTSLEKSMHNHPVLHGE